MEQIVAAEYRQFSQFVYKKNKRGDGFAVSSYFLFVN